MEKYSVLKRKEVLIHTTTWMNLLKKCLFLTYIERVAAVGEGRETERERERERERIQSGLCAVSSKPNTGLELINCDIMT